MSTATNTETPLDTLRACLEQLSHTLGIAGSLVRAGRDVDLNGLEGEIGFVCARALDLPPEEGRAARPALIGLRAQLEAMTAILSARGASPPA